MPKQITFQDVLDSGCAFDASGIDNPNDYKWYKVKNVYYPIL